MNKRANPHFVRAFMRGEAHLADAEDRVSVLSCIEENPEFYIRDEREFARYEALKREVETNV